MVAPARRRALAERLITLHLRATAGALRVGGSRPRVAARR
jgi:hypothetical protein